MAGLPEPEVGLVVSYSYLWREEKERGQIEGRKDRPCAIVLAVDQSRPAVGRKQVAVAPITHSQPRDPTIYDRSNAMTVASITDCCPQSSSSSS